jgi:hypothetical protein
MNWTRGEDGSGKKAAQRRLAYLVLKNVWTIRPRA